jgi:cytochrome d ubiquinol oxidase subunit I
MLRLGVLIAALLAPVQIVVGDFHGLNTLAHQPAKIAAIEAIWRTERGAPLLLFAMPNERTRSNDYALAVPKGASLILTHQLEGEVKGLDQFGDKHPPVAAVFWTFRVMVGMGMLMLGSSWLGAIYLVRRLGFPRWLLRVYAAMAFSGWIAVLAGWMTTEIGRQPYLVYGVLLASSFAAYPAVYRTGDAGAAYLPAMFVGVFVGLLAAAYIYAKGYEGGSGLVEGIRFGLLLGVFVATVFSGVNYATLNVGLGLAIVTGAAGLVEWTLLGTIIGLIYRPAAAPARRAAGV